MGFKGRIMEHSSGRNDCPAEVQGNEGMIREEFSGAAELKRRNSVLVAASALTALVEESSKGDDERGGAPIYQVSRRHSSGSDEEPGSPKPDGKQVLPKKKFPQILMHVLSIEEYSDMISWTPDGLGFDVTKPFDFTSDVLPRFFKEAQFASFVRKLNRWGFRRLNRGTDSGAFYHDLFRRDKPELCKKMSCKNVITPPERGRCPRYTQMPRKPHPFAFDDALQVVADNSNTHLIPHRIHDSYMDSLSPQSVGPPSPLLFNSAQVFEHKRVQSDPNRPFFVRDRLMSREFHRPMFGSETPQHLSPQPMANQVELYESIWSSPQAICSPTSLCQLHETTSPLPSYHQQHDSHPVDDLMIPNLPERSLPMPVLSPRPRGVVAPSVLPRRSAAISSEMEVTASPIPLICRHTHLHWKTQQSRAMLQQSRLLMKHPL